MNKRIKIILIVNSSILVLFIILAVVDYNSAMNGKSPVFTLSSFGYSEDDFFWKKVKIFIVDLDSPQLNIMF